jgi:hypothetical protein
MINYLNSYLDRKTNMAYIEYHGIDTRFCNASEFLNSARFRAVLDANPHLYLFESGYAGIWAEEVTLGEVNPPFPENYYPNLFIKDTKTDTTMWVLYDGLAEVEDPSPEFIEIMELMDAFSLKIQNQRIFEPLPYYKKDEPEMLAAEFDFVEGAYQIEASKRRIKKPTLNNVTISYAPFDEDNLEFINSQPMINFLDQHPYLKVSFGTMNYNTGEIIFTETTLPVTKCNLDTEEGIAIIDERWNYPYSPHLFIHSNAFGQIDDPSLEFIEILKLMDAFSVKTLKKRIFEAPLNFKTDDPEILAAEFDFANDEYIL